MSDKKSLDAWIKHQLMVAVLVLVGLQLLPAFVLILKPWLVLMAAGLILGLAVRLVAHHVTQRRQRW